MRHNEIRNRKLWDGLHEFVPGCFVCANLETNKCRGCTYNHSGENNNFESAVDDVCFAAGDN